MYKESSGKWRGIGCVLTVLADALLLLMICSFGAGCTRTVYLPVESVTVRVDTVERVVDRLLTDTVRERSEVYDIRRDSMAPVLDSLNRVIGWERWHYRERTTLNDYERARLLNRIDSLKRIQADSVYVDRPVPYEVEKTVYADKPLLWWQKTLMWTGVTALAIGVIFSLRALKKL